MPAELTLDSLFHYGNTVSTVNATTGSYPSSRVNQSIELEREYNDYNGGLNEEV